VTILAVAAHAWTVWPPVAVAWLAWNSRTPVDVAYVHRLATNLGDTP
jgi:hypothetical protein